MKSDIDSLKSNVDTLYNSIIKAGSFISEKESQASALATKYRILSQSLTEAEKCRATIDLATKAELYLKQNKLFHALKSINLVSTRVKELQVRRQTKF